MALHARSPPLPRSLAAVAARRSPLHAAACGVDEARKGQVANCSFVALLMLLPWLLHDFFAS